jgi:D-amino-acid dehydrogenase
MRIGDKLRVAAMVDMVGEDLTLTLSRSDGLTRQVKEPCRARQTT